LVRFLRKLVVVLVAFPDPLLLTPDGCDIGGERRQISRLQYQLYVSSGFETVLFAL